MIDESVTADDPRMQAAIAEMQAIISERHPTATYSVRPVGDMPGIWMIATVDLDDADDIIDFFSDRLLEIQLTEGLPLHVLPEQTPERYAETQRKERERTWRPTAAPVAAVI